MISHESRLNFSSYTDFCTEAEAAAMGRAVGIMWHDQYQLESEEYVIYDLPTIVAAVGGGIGLFIGLSCYQVHNMAFPPQFWGDDLRFLIRFLSGAWTILPTGGCLT